MNNGKTCFITNDEITQILETAAIFKTCGLKEKNDNPELCDFVVETADNLYDLAYSLMYREDAVNNDDDCCDHDCGGECCDDSCDNSCDNSSCNNNNCFSNCRSGNLKAENLRALNKENLGSATNSSNTLVVYLSEEDSDITGTKRVALTFNKYPDIKPELKGEYLVKLNNKTSPDILFYFPEFDNWEHPYNDWMPVNRGNVIGWLSIV